MNSPKSPVSTATPSHRKQHNNSSSLGSLYEILADLNETELQYLMQEMNHTGHQNLSVSEAVSTFEGQNPCETPKPRANMLPPAQVPQRQLSKSQRGKLRLQTAFQRASSLRQRSSQEDNDTDQTIYKTRKTSGQEPTTNDSIPVGIIKTSNCRPIQASEIRNDLFKSDTKLDNKDDLVENIPLNPQTCRRGISPAYRYIPRPDFNLPDGITVADLLQLLETEFLSSRSQQSSSGSSLSPSSESRMPLVPKPPLLSPASPISFHNASQSRPLRRVSSRLEMVLEAERTVSGTEEIGMGMLEPRQQMSVSRDSPAARTPITTVNSLEYQLKGETPPPLTPPVVLEGILDVLENY